MTFHFAPAVRERVSLIIALAAASGGGKTLSALKIARGLVGGDDAKIFVLDTEARRAKHYAVGPGEQPGPDRFAFQHGDLKAPFAPEAYAEAIKAADDAGAEVIVVDSCSHEYEGEGGITEMHDENVVAAVDKARGRHQPNWGAFDEGAAAERANIGAWKEPKARHKRFVNRLLQSRAHLILCLRADEKLSIQQVEDERGRKRTVIVQAKDQPPNKRWTPICEKRFMFEMTLSLILTPENPGIPVPIKLQAQHRDAVPLDRHLSEETGRALAEWARGGIAASPSPRYATGPAAGQAAPPKPTNPGGAAPVPSYTADEYVETWDELLRDATPAEAQEIGARWNSDFEKTIRRNTFEKDDTRLRALITRVGNRLAELRRVTT